jgi:hypothetical protein
MGGQFAQAIELQQLQKTSMESDVSAPGLKDKSAEPRVIV